MSTSSTLDATPTRPGVLFMILGGTTIPNRAAIVRAECREGSRVELRLARSDAGAQVDVWLECRSLLGLVKAWKKIGHVPADVAAALSREALAGSEVVGYGTVKSIYAPAGRQEAAVTVEIPTPESAAALL